MFIDETGASTKMARLRGRARRGMRCRSPIPHGHWKTTTFTGALRLTGMTAPMVLDGPMTGEWFGAYTRDAHQGLADWRSGADLLQLTVHLSDLGDKALAGAEQRCDCFT